MQGTIPGSQPQLVKVISAVPSSSKVPSNYDVGCTIEENSSTLPPNSNGSGCIITYKVSDIRCVQISVDYAGGMKTRGALNGSTWSEWNP